MLSEHKCDVGKFSLLQLRNFSGTGEINWPKGELGRRYVFLEWRIERIVKRREGKFRHKSSLIPINNNKKMHRLVLIGLEINFIFSLIF